MPEPQSASPTRAAGTITETIYGRKRVYFGGPSAGQDRSLGWGWQDEVDMSKAAVAEPARSATSRSQHGFRIGDWIPRSVNIWVRTMFLPVGYPDSVHSCYTAVHKWQFVETFLGSMVSVLCSEAMLESLGVGTAAAAGGAVAIQWMLKDGFGEIGKLLFIHYSAKSFDSHPKSWKMVGEAACLLGSTTQLSTILAPGYLFLPLASLGYCLRSIHFSIWNATHMTFTRNFANSGNVGDIVAKDDSQMSLAHLCGMVAGVSTLAISHSPWFLFASFFTLAPVHYYCTYKLVNAIQFEVFNEAKLGLVTREYVKSGQVMTMLEIQPKEIMFGEWANPKELIPKIVMTRPISKVFSSYETLRGTCAVLKGERYLLGFSARDQSVAVVLHIDAEADDILKAYLHAMKYHAEWSHRKPDMDNARHLEILAETYEWMGSNFDTFRTELDIKGWNCDVVFFMDSGHRAEWERRPDICANQGCAGSE